MMELKYKFEKTSDGDFQVRLKGEFVCYCDHKNEKLVDQELHRMGFESRQDFLDYCWE